MTDLPFNHIVGFCGAVAFLALIVIGIVVAAWQELCEQGRKCGKAFLAVFSIGAVVATIHAQKPPTPPVVKGMKLRITNVTAKGFDCAWDYGGLDPAGFTDGETVKLTALITGLDYTFFIGTLPPTVTNYHVNAVARGFPRDWMRYDVKVTARLNNSLLMGEAEHNGDESNDLPSINDAEGNQ